ncbi:MAG: hypothetical protein ABIP95_10090 [Pelobium sp.]
MFKQFIQSLHGDEVYMLLSLMIFFLFFIAATVALIRMKKSHIEYMSDIPLKSTSSEELN